MLDEKLKNYCWHGGKQQMDKDLKEGLLDKTAYDSYAEQYDKIQLLCRYYYKQGFHQLFEDNKAGIIDDWLCGYIKTDMVDTRADIEFQEDRLFRLLDENEQKDFRCPNGEERPWKENREVKLRRIIASL